MAEVGGPDRRGRAQPAAGTSSPVGEPPSSMPMPPSARRRVVARAGLGELAAVLVGQHLGEAGVERVGGRGAIRAGRADRRPARHRRGRRHGRAADGSYGLDGDVDSGSADGGVARDEPLRASAAGRAPGSGTCRPRTERRRRACGHRVRRARPRRTRRRRRLAPRRSRAKSGGGLGQPSHVIRGRASVALEADARHDAGGHRDVDRPAHVEPAGRLLRGRVWHCGGDRARLLAGAHDERVGAVARERRVRRERDRTLGRVRGVVELLRLRDGGQRRRPGTTPRCSW